MKIELSSFPRGARQGRDAFRFAQRRDILIPTLCALLLPLAAAPAARAQTAPAPSAAAQANTGSDVVRMNPFEIEEAKDESFQAATMGSASLT
jgi:hypothetical protein